MSVKIMKVLERMILVLIVQGWIVAANRFVSYGVKKSHTEAFDYCRDHQQKFVTIDTSQKHSEVMNYIHSSLSGNIAYIWIDLIYYRDENLLKTTEGIVSEYLSWDVRQPSNNMDAHCVRMSTNSSNFKLGYCNREKHFICEDNRSCDVICGCENEVYNWSDPLFVEKVTVKLENIKKNLTIEKATLTSYKNSKISAGDERKSAAVTGLVGVVILVLVVAAIIIPDGIKLIKFLYLHAMRKSRTINGK